MLAQGIDSFCQVIATVAERHVFFPKAPLHFKAVILDSAAAGQMNLFCFNPVDKFRVDIFSHQDGEIPFTIMITIENFCNRFRVSPASFHAAAGLPS